MRTNYNRQRRGAHPAAKWLIALGVLLLCAGAAALWRPNLTSFLWRVATPFVGARNALGGGESADLRAELASTTAALSDRDLLYRENLDLKARLNRDISVHRTLAAVLQRPPSASYDTFIIDAGASLAVKAGQRVYAAGNLAIGEVSEVYATTARVSLYSSPGLTYAASLIGSAGAPTPLQVVGQGGGSFVAEVPAGTQARVGDPVVFAGTADQLVAKVSAINMQEGSSFVDLYLHLPVDLFALRYVEIEQ